MALEGANVASNVNRTEMPTTTETTIAKEVATSSNGDTDCTPSMNTIQTPNNIGIRNTVVGVSTSSYTDARSGARSTPNVHAMESINAMKTSIAMELFTSSEVDTKMMIDGSSSVDMLKVMVDERTESKECKSPSSMNTESFEQVILGQSAVRVENYIEEENAGNSPLLQDDMFSLAELSVVENQQLDEATTVSDHCYESMFGSDQLATSISGSGENNLQGVTKVMESVESLMPRDDTNEKGNIEHNIEQVIEHTKVGDATNGRSIGNLENDSQCIDHIPNAGDASTGHDGQVKDYTSNIPNLAMATTYVVDHDNKIKNGHRLPLEVSDVANASHDDKDERESVNGNQATLSKSQPEVVMVKEINDTYSTEAERAGMKEEQRASIKEEEYCQQNLPERIPWVKQAELEVKQHSEDKKSEEMEIPSSGLVVSINEGTVNMDIEHPSQGPSEKLMESKNMLQDSVSIKEEIGPQELSQNVMLEKASENSPKIIREAYDKSHTEHIAYKDGQQLQEIPEEFELLKGRKVSKKFGRKKYLGEVLGYDPTTKWFKVLYEDGDEEEVEKNELHSILLPLDGNLVVSRKRQLPTDDDGHENTNRTGRKSIKLNMQATPRKQVKNETTGNEITVSNQVSSSTKKRKPSAVKSGGKSKGKGKGKSKSKSKSPKARVPKTQKGKSQSTLAKKSIEKEKSEKKSQSTKSKNKPKNQMKQSLSKKAMVVAQNQSQSVTRKLKYGSATKKNTSTKAKQKAKDIPPKNKEEKTPQLSITEKSATATSSRKRKADTDVQGKASMVSGKRTRSEMVNDVESPPLRKTESKRRRITEDGTEAHLQVTTENNDTNDDSIPLPTGNRHVRLDKGSVLIGRKVRKDFGGSLYGGEIIGYKMYYNVKYDDGDTEDLNWKELESILLPEEGGSSQPKHGKHNTENKVNPVKSKPNKKN